MQWELVATWLTTAVSLGGMVFAMGKQTQKITNQQEQIDELKVQVKESQETPIKLATLETDIKYLVQEISTIKQFIMSRSK